MILPPTRDYKKWFIMGSAPLYISIGIIGILAYLEDSGVISANLDNFYDILLPIFFVSIIEGALVHLIYHILNFVDLKKLHLLTPSHSDRKLLLPLFIAPYRSLIVKQKILRDYLNHLYKKESKILNPYTQAVILLICLIPGIWGIVEYDYLYEHMGNFLGLSFILITLLLNPLPLRIIEYQWQNTLNKHIQDKISSKLYPGKPYSEEEE